MTGTDKSIAAKCFSNHETHAQNEIELYVKCISDAALSIPDDRENNLIIQPCPTDIRNVHMAFDFAQQLNIPQYY